MAWLPTSSARSSSVLAGRWIFSHAQLRRDLRSQLHCELVDVQRIQGLDEHGGSGAAAVFEGVNPLVDRIDGAAAELGQGHAVERVPVIVRRALQGLVAGGPVPQHVAEELDVLGAGAEPVDQTGASGQRLAQGLARERLALRGSAELHLEIEIAELALAGRLVMVLDFARQPRVASRRDLDGNIAQRPRRRRGSRGVCSTCGPPTSGAPIGMPPRDGPGAMTTSLFYQRVGVFLQSTVGVVSESNEKFQVFRRCAAAQPSSERPPSDCAPSIG